MKNLNEVDLKNKKVVLRAGFNVPVENGEIDDDIRIRAALPTVEYILKQQPKVLVIISHLGRPEGKRDPELSNDVVAKRLGELLSKEVEMLDDVEALRGVVGNENDLGKIYLLENIRFWPQEEEGDEEFGKSIGKLFDVYVNDCFSASHRDHVSFTKVPKYTKEKCAGLLFEKELTNLEKVRNNPEQPAVMVIGGAKIATKLPVIENLMKIYDKILVGGMIANEAIDEKVELSENVLLPVDFAPAGKEDQRLDIGPETIKNFLQEISGAETIVWNGPMGKFEDDDAAEGTKKIMQAIAKEHEAHQVIGGGETLEAIKQFGDFSDFDYVSMSGGAMLEFLAGKELPGIKALN